MADRFRKEDPEILRPKTWFEFEQRDQEAKTRSKELEVETREAKIEQQNRLLQEQIHESRRRRAIATTLLVVFIITIIFTAGIILLSGFRIGGFVIETSTINLLIGATIGEIVTIFTATLRGVFSCKDETPQE